MTKLTDACLIPSCLFKYFSSPLEQALHVIPSIFKRTFFMILCSFLNVILLKLYILQYVKCWDSEKYNIYNFDSIYFITSNPASSIAS